MYVMITKGAIKVVSHPIFNSGILSQQTYYTSHKYSVGWVYDKMKLIFTSSLTVCNHSRLIQSEVQVPPGSVTPLQTHVRHMRPHCSPLFFGLKTTLSFKSQQSSFWNPNHIIVLNPKENRTCVLVCVTEVYNFTINIYTHIFTHTYCLNTHTYRRSSLSFKCFYLKKNSMTFFGMVLFLNGQTELEDSRDWRRVETRDVVQQRRKHKSMKRGIGV